MSKAKTNVVRFIYNKGFVLIRLVTHCIMVIKSRGRKRVVPPITDPVLLKSATRLAEEIREGKLTSEQVVRSYIERIRVVQPYINAVVEERFELALEEAKAADAVVRSGSYTLEQLKQNKPFFGVPFSVKILIGVKGLRLTAGSTIFHDSIAEEDALAVANMKNAGAICIASTNTPEFGLGFETSNHLHGNTRNPYDTTRTSAGSSGGEGALIGAAGSVIGLGNDIGGSVRLPSLNNCIFGHKPTAGVIPNIGTVPSVLGYKVNDYLTIGPMCRYAEDLTTAMKVLAGPRRAELRIGEPVDLSQLKIYYMLGETHISMAPKVENDILQSIKKVVKHFEDVHRSNPTKVNFKSMKHSFDIWIQALISGIEGKIDQTLSRGKVDIKPGKEFLKLLLGKSQYAIGTVFAYNIDKLPRFYKYKDQQELDEAIDKIRKDFDEILDGYSVLLMPSYTCGPQYHNENYASLASAGFSAIFNILGFPATQCALGLDAEGLPLGFQVVANKNCDNLSLAVALEIERAFGGWVPPSHDLASNGNETSSD